MASDLISRSELLEAMNRRFVEYRNDNNDKRNTTAHGFCLVEQLMREVPTVDAAPVVHGEWEQCFEDWRKQIEGDKCSACGFEHYGAPINHYHYCPNCGAKMDGGIGTAEDICKTTNIPCIKCNPGPCEHRKKG